ncbi:radical SAM protein [Candidatus Woesearchaeota archaeon]|nr:radical SAM protein [Candidatus Woesearchaeota archaeon]
MSTKSILINYGSQPLLISSLMPDAGLAALAGSLVKHGHETVIEDFSTVNIVERLFPYQYSGDISSVVGKIMDSVERNEKIPDGDLDSLAELNSSVAAYRKDKVKEISRDIISRIIDVKPDFIGIKLWMGDAFKDSILIAEQIKKVFPGLPVIAGGSQVDIYKELVMEASDVFDVLVYGEAENVIVQLANALKKGDDLGNIPYLIYKQNGGLVKTPPRRTKDLDSLPTPLYDSSIYPAMEGDQKIKMLIIDESRGCPNSCNFCTHPIKSGRKWRKRSPERVVDIMEEYIEKYGVASFRFSGSNPPPSLQEGIAREILNRRLEVSYSQFAHAWARNPDYALLKESGCHALFFGVESGSQYILDNSINKNTTIERIRRAVTSANDAGIFTVTSFIYPAPLETDQTTEETINLILELAPGSVQISLPGVMTLESGWGSEPSKYSIQLDDEQTFERTVMSYRTQFGQSPILWEPLPYKINGKHFRQYLRQSEQFTRILEEKGLLTQITDEQALMAEHLNIPLREFRDINRSYLMEGNHKGISRIVSDLNRSMRAKLP